MQLVIFSSVYSIVALLVALVLYLLIAAVRVIFGDVKIVTGILGGLNILVHLAIFALCLYLKATTQEILFILTVSTALALTVTKTGKEKEE